MKNSTFLFLFFGLLILFSHLLANRSFAQTWVEQTSGISNDIYCIQAINENVVWAGANYGKYLRTIDGGATWVSGTIPGAAPYQIYSIYAIDTSIAYYATFSGYGNPGRIYKTIDGGYNWQLTYQASENHITFNSIAFLDTSGGIAVVETYNGNRLMAAVTSNGGTNWTENFNVPLPLFGEIGCCAYYGGTGLAVAGGNYAWFGTSYRIEYYHYPVRVMRSTDRGQTWVGINTALSTIGYEHGITSLTFCDTLTGFAGSTDEDGLGNTLAKTTDGGLTWNNVETFVAESSQVCTIRFVPGTNNKVLVASTWGGTVFSVDTGETWNSLSPDLFYGISFVNSRTGWGVGNNGRIAKFNGDLVTAIRDNISKATSSFNLLQNYPNPFNPATNIQYSIPQREYVTLTVYDILGNLVSTLVDEEKSGGTYTLKFNGSSLSSGVYFYQLKAGNYSKTKKLILMK